MSLITEELFNGMNIEEVRRGEENLKRFFLENKRVALAFSGGVDSAYLLYMGNKYAEEIKAYYVKGQFQPEFEFEDAKRLAENLGANIEIIEVNVLENPDVVKNPEDRCYYCKRTVFSLILERAASDGFKILMDGTNASDDEGDRPGMKALAELKVMSPLRISGLTKKQIRYLSKEAELFTWNKPSYACLATRVEPLTEITKEKLKAVEESETYLMSLGFEDFRVRLYGKSARIEVREEQLAMLLENRKSILERMSPLFDFVTLNLITR